MHYLSSIIFVNMKGFDYLCTNVSNTLKIYPNIIYNYATVTKQYFHNC